MDPVSQSICHNQSKSIKCFSLLGKNLFYTSDKLLFEPGNVLKQQLYYVRKDNFETVSKRSISSKKILANTFVIYQKKPNDNMSRKVFNCVLQKKHDRIGVFIFIRSLYFDIFSFSLFHLLMCNFIYKVKMSRTEKLFMNAGLKKIYITFNRGLITYIKLILLSVLYGKLKVI